MEQCQRLLGGLGGDRWVEADEANLVIAYPQGGKAITSPYSPNTDCMFGSQFNAYYLDHRHVGTWDATKVTNNKAIPSRTFDCSVDPTPIETELAQVVAIRDELVKPIG